LPGLEIKDSNMFDLSKPAVQEFIITLIRKGLVWAVHMGTPCTVWSTARRNIKHFQRARDKELLGVNFALFSVRVARICHQLSVGWSIENPASSKLWEFEPVAILANYEGVHFVHWHMCGYGESYRKRTSLLTNIVGYEQLQRACTRDHDHIALSGTHRVWDDVAQRFHWESRAQTAGAYPRALVVEWSGILRALAPANAVGHDFPDQKAFDVGIACAARAGPSLRKSARLHASSLWRDRRSSSVGPVSTSPELEGHIDAQKFMQLNTDIVFGQGAFAPSQGRQRRIDQQVRTAAARYCRG
jgi:hypothetical protein